MSLGLSQPDTADLTTEDYVVLGLATCFLKEDGQLSEVKILEPIPSAALEAIVKGIPTSYQQAYATTLGAALANPMSSLPQDFASAQLCDDFQPRAIAAARTYKRRVIAQEHISTGSIRSDFKYSVERKRILNSQRLVTNEDNVKQHEYTHKVL